MKNNFLLYIGILLAGTFLSSASCWEEGEWLEFDEAEKGEYLASRYVEDSTYMHLTPVASIQHYLQSGAKFKADKIRVVDSRGISCACSDRKNGNCLCKLPNNKRHECKTLDSDEMHVCIREKNIRIFVKPEFVTRAKKLGFE